MSAREASEVLSSDALPRTVILFVLRRIARVKSRRAILSASITSPFWWMALNRYAFIVRLYEFYSYNNTTTHPPITSFTRTILDLGAAKPWESKM